MQEALYRRPHPGLIAFAILSQWLGYSTYTVVETVFGAVPLKPAV